MNYPVHFNRSFHAFFHKTSENSDKSDRLTGSLGTVIDSKKFADYFFVFEFVLAVTVRLRSVSVVDTNEGDFDLSFQTIY